MTQQKPSASFKLRRMIAEGLKITGVNILVLLGILLLIEATGQVISVIHPSYDALFLQPDEIVGWKQVPNLRWTWAGHYWYASDFSVEVETNSLGFRDLEREFSKPQGERRVAVLGDSFIEAVQVPLEKTATQVLERRLNSSLEPSQVGRLQKWEVLNFGISNYGIGQYLLAWEEYASKYHPDYVAIFVAKLHMRRTLDKNEAGAFAATSKENLWIRPSFRLENDSLIREPAKDYNEFIKAQDYLIKTEFDGKRTRKKRTKLLTPLYAHYLWDDLKVLMRRLNKAPKQSTELPLTARDKDKELFAVNLKIIDELGRKVRSSGSKLIVVDASQYFGDDGGVSETLNNFCVNNDFGYIPLYRNLIMANSSGTLTKWPHDGHFNEDGNIIFADTLYDWIIRNP